MRNRLNSCILLCALFFSTSIQAQNKKDLTPDDYGKWQSLGATDLSPNGEWVAYQVTVQEDNDTLFVTNRAQTKCTNWSLHLRPNFRKTINGSPTALACHIKKRKNCESKANLLKYKMGLLNLTTGKKEVIQNISRFGFSRNGKFLAVYLAPPKENKDKGAVLLVKNLADGTTRTIGNVTEYRIQ